MTTSKEDGGHDAAGSVTVVGAVQGKTAKVERSKLGVLADLFGWLEMLLVYSSFFFPSV